MPKPPFVAKENVERFILSFVHENKKLPTMKSARKRSIPQEGIISKPGVFIIWS